MNMERNLSTGGLGNSTRDKLVRAAAELFDEVGYWGTDTNRIARAADYSPGTFYRHFKDKAEIFIAAYEVRSDAEWRDIRTQLSINDPETMVRVIRTIVEHHKRRVGLRSSLRALSATDTKFRVVQQDIRSKQLALILAELEVFWGECPDRFKTYSVMLVVERFGDAIADGEVEQFGFSENQAIEHLARLLDGLRRGQSVS